MSRTRPLWIIDPSVATPEDQGVEVVQELWAGPSRLFRPVLSPGDGPDPDSGYEAAGVVLMGSAASVHEPPAWMQGLSAWIKPVLSGEVRMPVLGICFGHQLIAHDAGGEVGFLDADRTKRVGIERSQLSGGRLLPGERALTVVVSHREEVTRAPQGYRVVARRQDVEIDGLEHDGLPIFSYQFHPEAREQFAERAGIDFVRSAPAVIRDSRLLLEGFLARL